MSGEPPKSPKPANDVFEKLDQHADALDNKIEAARDSYENSSKRKKKETTGAHIGIEFAGAIFVPTLIGWKLDEWLETSPAFMLILFFLGVCTGFYSIYRITNNLETSVGFSQLHREKKDAKTQSSDEN